MAAKPECKPFLERISVDSDGELSPGARRELLAHLDGCADCRARHADAKAASGLIRVHMDAAADGVDFAKLTQDVMARLEPMKLPLFERLRLSWAERWEHQRLALLGAMGAAAAVALIGTPLWMRQAVPEGYAEQRVAVQSVSTDVEAHVAPVVMRTDTGDSIIWVVDHAHVAVLGAPDASVPRDEVDSAATPAQNATQKPQGGEL